MATYLLCALVAESRRVAGPGFKRRSMSLWTSSCGCPHSYMDVSAPTATLRMAHGGTLRASAIARCHSSPYEGEGVVQAAILH
jgi:hypothetical protein